VLWLKRVEFGEQWDGAGFAWNVPGRAWPSQRGFVPGDGVEGPVGQVPQDFPAGYATGRGIKQLAVMTKKEILFLLRAILYEPQDQRGCLDTAKCLNPVGVEKFICVFTQGSLALLREALRSAGNPYMLRNPFGIVFGSEPGWSRAVGAKWGTKFFDKVGDEVEGFPRLGWRSTARSRGMNT